MHYYTYRVSGIIDPEVVKSGKLSIMYSLDQEFFLLVQYHKSMAEVGYGYSRTDFAIHLGIRVEIVFLQATVCIISLGEG